MADDVVPAHVPSVCIYVGMRCLRRARDTVRNNQKRDIIRVGMNRDSGETKRSMYLLLSM